MQFKVGRGEMIYFCGWAGMLDPLVLAGVALTVLALALLSKNEG